MPRTTARIECRLGHHESAPRKTSPILDLKPYRKSDGRRRTAHRIRVRHAANAAVRDRRHLDQSADHLLRNVDDVVLRHERRFDVDLRELRPVVGHAGPRESIAIWAAAVAATISSRL